MGFPVFPIEWTDPETGEKSSGYRESGYLSQAVINLLALLGWNPGVEQEIFSLDELFPLFDLEKTQKSGAKFDPEKAKWFNQQHLKLISTDVLAVNFFEELKEKKINTDISTVKRIVELVKERAVFTSDLWEISSYFFTSPEIFDEKALKKFWKDDTTEIILKLSELLNKTDDFSSNNLEEITKQWITDSELSYGKVLNPLRILLVGTTTGVHLFDIIDIIGKSEFKQRVENGIKKINKN